jgi:hypothetical protein
MRGVGRIVGSVRTSLPLWQRLRYLRDWVPWSTLIDRDRTRDRHLSTSHNMRHARRRSRYMRLLRSCSFTLQTFHKKLHMTEWLVRIGKDNATFSHLLVQCCSKFLLFLRLFILLARLSGLDSITHTGTYGMRDCECEGLRILLVNDVEVWPISTQYVVRHA